MTEHQLRVDIVRAISFHGDCAWNFQNVTYPYNTLYFVEGGDGYVRVGGEVTALKSGRAYLIAAGITYDCWCDSHIDKLYADVHVETVPGWDVFLGSCKVREIPFPLAEIRALMAAGDKQGMKDSLYVQGTVYKAVALFMDEDFELPGKEFMRFAPLLYDIDRNLSAELRVADVARAHNWDAAVLSRSFKKTFHCSVKLYVEKLLLDRVKQELIISSKSLKEIAAEYRFCDQYYFSNFFKRRQGCSPSRYRAENRRQ